MAEIRFEPIGRANWRKTLALKVRPAGDIWEPFVILTDDEMVGLIELAYRPDGVDRLWIFHFMIDHRFQGRGLGRQAFEQFMKALEDRFPDAEGIDLSVHPENEAAVTLYRGLGFVETGRFLDGEAILTFPFN